MARVAAPLLAGALLGAVVGAAATWVALSGAGGGGIELDAAAKTARSSSPAALAARASSPVSEVAAPVERTDARPADTSAPAELVERVAEVARLAPATSDGRGDRTIRGRVTDAHGRPIEGVLVRATRNGDESGATPQRSESGRAAPPPPTLEEVLRRAAEQFYERGSDWRDASTDAQGGYAIVGLRAGRYQVQAWREGLRFSVQGERGEGEVRPDAKVDFLGKAVVAVPIDVLLPGGKPAPAAFVTASAERRGGDESSGWTAQEPTLPLLPGEWEIGASLGDPNSGPPWPELLTAAKVKITVVEGVVPPPVTLELKGEPGVRGRVLRPDGTLAQAAMVRLLAQESGAPDFKRLAEGNDLPSAWAENGEYLFREVKPGRYVVGVARSWRGPVLAHAEVEVRSGMVVKDLVLPELDPAACVIASVTGPDGDVVSEARFQWRVERDKGNWQNDANAERKEPGTWWLPIEAVGNADFDPMKPWPPQTRLILVTWAEGLGSTALEVYQATRSVAVGFGPPATLQVTIPGFVGGHYVDRVRFFLDRAGDGVAKYGWGADGTPGRDDGVATLGPVEAGRYRLVMRISDNRQGGWMQNEVASREVSLSSGENGMTMAIPTLHVLTVRIPAGGEGRLQFQLQMVGKAAQRWRQVEVGKDGTVTFNDLPPGEWRLTCTGGSAPGVMQVSVPAAGPVDFTPMSVTALRVVLLDRNGQLAAAGFRDGDLVVALEGREITSLLDLQLLQSAARVKKEITFTVLRGAEKSELTLDARFVNDAARLGGSLEPATR